MSSLSDNEGPSSVPTNADAVPSRAATPIPSSAVKNVKLSPAAGGGAGGGAGGANAAGGGGGGGGKIKTEGGVKIKTEDALRSAAAAPAKPIRTSTYVPHDRPPFPEPGSTLGLPDNCSAGGGAETNNIREVGRYFTLGRLGRGTFCSIHKCVDLGYHHTLSTPALALAASDAQHKQSEENTQRKEHKQRIVAAKVELSTFANSGVLDGEATVLRHLSKYMPEEQIPLFFGYVKENVEGGGSGADGDVVGGMGGVKAEGLPSPRPPPGVAAAALNAVGGDNVGGNTNADSSTNASPAITSAILMEHLPGEDMHRLRDRHCNAQGAAALHRAKRRAKKQQQKLVEKGQHQEASKIKTVVPSPNATRRLCAGDAVYLTAEVMLPLIESMHSVGCIHRDVKPSNCVRMGTTEDARGFKLVDFGLSKSFVVPVSSSMAEPAEGAEDSGKGGEKRMWDGLAWDCPPELVDGETGRPAQGCFRSERSAADFRGTSMYASLRVHQGRDYCRRDDVWGLLYVFCDLVSGGLPWMAYALNRERDMCRKIKEVVHGERKSVDDDDDEDGEVGEEQDQISLLLMGADYHTTKFRRDKVLRDYQEKNPGSDPPPEDQLPKVAQALPLASDAKKIGLLRKAFDHVSKLGFYDAPDYELLASCLRGFLDDDAKARLVDEDNGDKVDPFCEADIVPIEWAHSASDAEALRRRREAKKKGEDVNEMMEYDYRQEAARRRRYMPTFNMLGTDAFDPLESETVLEADRDRQASREVALAAAEAAEKAGDMAAAKEAAASALPPPMSVEAEDLSRLPLDLQLKVAQVEYNARNPETIAPHLALRDWMDLARALLYQKWDVAGYERGNHRSNGDGYKREFLIRIVGRCLEAAKPFGCFTKNMDCFYYPKETTTAIKQEEGDEGPSKNTGAVPPRKKRKIEVAPARKKRPTGRKQRPTTPRLELSRAFSGLRGIIELEKARKFAPPPKISFLG